MPLARVLSEGDAPRARKFSKAPCRERHYAPENLRVVIRACPSFHQCCWQCERRTLELANAATPPLHSEAVVVIKKQYKKGNACVLAWWHHLVRYSGRLGLSCHQPFGSRSHFGSRARREPVFWPWRFVFPPARAWAGWRCVFIRKHHALLRPDGRSHASRAAVGRRSTQPRNPRGPRAAGSLREEASALCRWRGC